MLRKFNYTGRKRIPRSAVTIRLHNVEGGPPRFDADYDLSELKLPGHAAVYVEAYHRASYMRFGFGCVSDKQIPENTQLLDIEGGGSAQFRLKVIDESAEHGQVLAEADGIVPLEKENEAEGSRRSILPVIVSDDLGDQLWRVRLDCGDGRPVLELNNKIEGIAQMARTDDFFLSMVHPAVVQIVLRQVLRGAHRVDTLDLPEEDWRAQWIAFARSMPGIGDPPLLEDDNFTDEELESTQTEWIDCVVAAFCSKYRTLEGLGRALDRRGQ